MAKIKIKIRETKKDLNLRRKPEKKKMKNKNRESKLLVKKRIRGVKEKSNTKQDESISKIGSYKEKLSNIILSYDADNPAKSRRNKIKSCNTDEKLAKLFYEFFGKEQYNSSYKGKSVSYVLKNMSDENFKRLVEGHISHHSGSRVVNNGYNVCVAIFGRLRKLLNEPLVAYKRKALTAHKKIDLMATLLLCDSKTDFLERILKIYTTPGQIVEFVKNLDQFHMDEFLYFSE